MQRLGYLISLAVCISILLGWQNFSYASPDMGSPKSAVELVNIHTEPAVVRVDDTFTINATVVNNSSDIITFGDTCESPLSLEFEVNVTIEYVSTCTGANTIQLKPGAKIPVGSPSGIIYRAAAPGVTYAIITFAYEIENKLISDPRLRESLVFTIIGGQQVDSSWKTYDLTYRGTILNIPYKISNGALKDITMTQNMTIVIQSGDRDGVFEIRVPSISLPEWPYVVRIDGHETEYRIIEDLPCFTRFLIPFPANSKTIEISYAFWGTGIVAGEPVLPPAPRYSFYVSTDKTYYQIGEPIKISGCRTTDLDSKLRFEIIMPERGSYVTYSTTYLKPNTDGTFSFSVIIEGERPTNGTYTLITADDRIGKFTTNDFVIPEFPVNLMAVTTVGLIGALVALRFKTKL